MKVSVGVKIKKVELNLKGFNALRSTPEVMADLQARADRIAAAAGEGMVAEQVYVGKDRARVAVYTDTIEAKKAEAEDRALTIAIEAGR